MKLSGEIEHYRARLIAPGYDQAHGVDYFENFSPVIKPATIRIILSLAVQFQWSIKQFNVHNAFLNGELHEDVFMSQPPSFIDRDTPSHVCKLKNALYDLKQCPREWFLKLSSCLLSWHFHAAKSDASIFIYNKNSILVIILIYVDDTLVTGNSLSFIQQFIGPLNSLFALKDLGDLPYFLGIHVTRDTKHPFTYPSTSIFMIFSSMLKCYVVNLFLLQWLLEHHYPFMMVTH